MTAYYLDNNDDEDCFPRQFSSDHSDVVVVDGDDEDVQAVLGASEIYCLLRQFLWRQMTAERRRLTNDPLCQIYLSIYSLAPLPCQINSLSLSDLPQYIYLSLCRSRYSFTLTGGNFAFSLSHHIKTNTLLSKVLRMQIIKFTVKL